MENINENTNVTTKNASLTLITEQSFLDKRIRVFGTPEDPLFLARDVAEWIEHKDVSTMMRNVDKEEKLTQTLFVSGQGRGYWFLTEDGLYEVLMQSRKPKAKEFKKEVKKILKSIRKTGGYVVGQENMPKEVLLAHAVLESQKIIEENAREIAKLHNECTLLNDQVEHSQEIIDAFSKNITPSEKRAILNRLMTWHHGAVAGSRWTVLYREFEAKYHFNLDVRINNYNKNPDNKRIKSKLEYVDRVLGMLDQLYELAVKLFHSDAEALIEEMYYVRKTDEEILQDSMLDTIPDEVFERSNN